MDYINKANLYFQYFKSKDIVSLSDLFSNNIILKDWNINVNGYKNVVNQNKLIFDSLGDFDLLVKKLSQVENIVFAEIEIITNKEVTIVLDKLEFDSDGKIFKITAFKG